MLKNYISLIVLFSLFINSIAAQYEAVEIPDSNFEQALIDQGADSYGVIDGIISYYDYNKIISLNVSNSNIRSLSGIEFFSNLTYLDCSNNNISSLNGAGGRDLRTLILRGNKFSTLTIQMDGFSYKLNHIDVSDNPNLTYLYVNTDQDYDQFTI